MDNTVKSPSENNTKDDKLINFNFKDLPDEGSDIIHYLHYIRNLPV